MTRAEVSAMAEQHCAAAITTKRALGDDVFEPMLALTDRAGRTHLGILAVPRDAVADAIAAMVSAHRAVAVALVLDTWLGPAAMSGEALAAALRKYGSVRNMPGRMDALVAIAEAPGCRVGWAARYVEVDAEIVFEPPAELPGEMRTPFLAKIRWDDDDDDPGEEEP